MSNIQVQYDDVLNTDNHGRVYLKDSDGNEINCENSIEFWSENYTDSFQEYVFPTLENNQYDYEIWGEFWTS